LMGGGTGGVEAAGFDLSKNPLFRGSEDEVIADVDCSFGDDSSPGVPFLLAILKNPLPLEYDDPGVGESYEERGRGRPGRGECTGLGLFPGDAGECISTLGGDLVRALGGENAIIEEGLVLGVLHGVRRDLPRGVVAETVPL
jgi:hypothetical protein